MFLSKTQMLFHRSLRQFCLLLQREKPTGCKGSEICRKLSCSSCCHIHVIHHDFAVPLFGKVKDMLLQRRWNDFLLFVTEVAIGAYSSLDIKGQYLGTFMKLYTPKQIKEIPNSQQCNPNNRFFVHTIFTCDHLQITALDVFRCGIYPHRPEECQQYQCHLLINPDKKAIVNYQTATIIAAYEMTERVINWAEADLIAKNPVANLLRLRQNGARSLFKIVDGTLDLTSY